MKRRLTAIAIVAALAAVVGVGLAASLGPEEPTHLPNANADEVYVAGPDGEALRCNGKLAKVKRSALGGRIPPLTPAQAAKRGPVDARMKVARCAVGADGRETGGVVFVDAG